MICFKLNWLFYDTNRMLQLSEFVCSWICMFFSINRFNNVLLIDATGRSNISSDQKRLFFAVTLYPLSFFANTSFKLLILSNPSFTFSKIFLIYATVQCFVQLPETCNNMSIIIFQESKNFKYLWSTAFKSAWVNTRNIWCFYLNYERIHTIRTQRGLMHSIKYFYALHNTLLWVSALTLKLELWLLGNTTWD